MGKIDLRKSAEAIEPSADEGDEDIVKMLNLSVLEQKD